MAEHPESGDAGLNDHRDPLPTRVEGLPPLPAEYHAAMYAVLEELEAVGVVLGPGERDTIDDHLRMLVAWNGAINLTAIVDPEGMARRHVADCLAAIPVILEGPHATVVDIGAGAGFPGVPLAAAMANIRVTLVESVGKKAAFLRTVADLPGLTGRVRVQAERAEVMAPGQWDLVTARAVGPLADLIELGLPLLAGGGRLIAWKRGDISEELAAAGRATRALGGSAPRWRPHPEGVGRAAELEGHGVVVVDKVAPTPSGFPRDPAGRKRRPW